MRLLRPADAAAIAAFRSDPDVARYVPWEPPYAIEKAEAMIERMRGRAFDDAGPDGLILAVERASDGLFIGDAMIKHDGGDPRLGVIGYALARSAHGHGFATELGRGLIDRFFASPDSHRVAAWCDARNAASVRVLEKCGMRLEAEFRQGVFCKGEWVDERVYALLRTEWLATR